MFYIFYCLSSLTVTIIIVNNMAHLNWKVLTVISLYCSPVVLFVTAAFSANEFQSSVPAFLRGQGSNVLYAFYGKRNLTDSGMQAPTGT